MSLRHKKKKILVVAHDAGGAEVIAAYVRTHKNLAHHRIYAAGPARRIFRRNGLSTKRAPKTRNEMRTLMQRSVNADLALLGTGWMTSIEKNSLEAAKRVGIKTAVYLDSWMNYREVFGYPRGGWRKKLPDEFWAGDRAALSLAKKYFPRTPVRFVKNQYFTGIVSRYERYFETASRPNDVLFMSAAGKISENIFRDFLAELSKVGFAKAVRIRLHPADTRARYEEIVRHNAVGFQVEISGSRDIVQDLLRAQVVVGPETNALVPAVLNKIPAIRIVPKGEKAFLPFKEILKVKSAKDAVRAIYSGNFRKF